MKITLSLLTIATVLFASCNKIPDSLAGAKYSNGTYTITFKEKSAHMSQKGSRGSGNFDSAYTYEDGNIKFYDTFHTETTGVYHANVSTFERTATITKNILTIGYEYYSNREKTKRTATLKKQ